MVSTLHTSFIYLKKHEALL